MGGVWGRCRVGTIVLGLRFEAERAWSPFEVSNSFVMISTCLPGLFSSGALVLRVGLGGAIAENRGIGQGWLEGWSFDFCDNCVSNMPRLSILERICFLIV